MPGFSQDQKFLIEKRDWFCIPHHLNKVAPFEAQKCSGSYLAHHRLNRGMGGSPSRNRVANGMLICQTLNQELEMNPDIASEARKWGWKLRTEQEILTVPIWVPHLRRLMYLDDEGNYLPHREAA